MSALYTRYRLSYSVQTATALLSIPFCVWAWPRWAWTTSIIVNLALLPPLLGMTYLDRKRAHA